MKLWNYNSCTAALYIYIFPFNRMQWKIIRSIIFDHMDVNAVMATGKNIYFASVSDYSGQFWHDAVPCLLHEKCW